MEVAQHASVTDGSQAVGEQPEAVRAALDLRIGPDTDLDTVTRSLVAAHDALQHRLSDLSS